jgi:hypothetical protein
MQVFWHNPFGVLELVGMSAAALNGGAGTPPMVGRQDEQILIPAV